MTILLPTSAPAGPRGLFVMCKDCRKDFRASELVGLACIACRVHLACADVRADLAVYIRKQRRFHSLKGIEAREQFVRYHRRLIKRVQALVADPSIGMQLVEKELQSVFESSGVITRGGVLEAVHAQQLR